MEEKLRVGVISSTHGIRGEVKVFPTTDNPERFRKIKEVILDMGKDEIVLEIEGVKFFKKFAILKFKGIDNINDVEKYKGGELYVTRKNAPKLGKDEYFIADLLGMDVTEDTGRKLGKVKDIIETGANDVYVVEMENKKELLIPAIRQCILKVDIEAGLIEVHLLEGLLEE
ncbi:16S rRNA processing protein RimM [Lachnospiraceae bacterium]|nr:16S rRNA processing protein RimM [Lachnospiraceae bacterium]